MRRRFALLALALAPLACSLLFPVSDDAARGSRAVDGAIDRASGAFDISVDDKHAKIRQGGTTSIHVVVQPASGTDDAVLLDIADAPAGIAAPRTALAPGESQGVLALQASTTAATGTTDVTIIATSGSRQASTRITLTVTPPAGALDSTFGDAGIVLSDVPYEGVSALAAQSDNALLVATTPFSGPDGGLSETFAIRRFRPDGAPDPSFGASGRAETAIGTRSKIRALAVQADGKIVAAGEQGPGTGPQIALARYTADGALDTGFGNGGIVTTNVGVGSTAHAIAFTDQGALALAGSTYDTRQRPLIVRYTSSGSLDVGFGDAGALIPDVGEGAARMVAALPSGDLLVSGERYTSYSWWVARLAASGLLVPSFGDGGVASTEPFVIASLIGAATLPSGGAVLAGSTRRGDKDPPFFAGFTETGAAITSFRDGGALDVPSFYFSSFARQADGALVLAGVGQGSRTFMLVRCTPDGALDPTFGSGGIVTTDRPEVVSLQALTIQPDGMLVVAGWQGVSPGTPRMLLARYWP